MMADYDRSAIIVCKPVVISEQEGTDVTDAFVAMLIGLGRLSLKQRGIQEQFYNDKVLIENYMNRCGDPDAVFVGVTLSIVGRDTCVVKATSEHEEWKGKQLIVKINFIGKAQEKARNMTQGKRPDWALDHLPDILLSQDFGYDAKSPQANLADFFAKTMFADKKFEYEGRVCRIAVEERLYSFDELQTASRVCSGLLRHFAQDISKGNIMWRRTIDGHLRGVLNDFDFSSFRDDTTSLLQRVGTRPYTAYELFDKKYVEDPPPTKHLYRHDVESIFYVIFVVVTSSTLHRNLPNVRFHPTVNSGFADFQPWMIRSLVFTFSSGGGFFSRCDMIYAKKIEKRKD
ncbi:uncharacterized protein EV420DRAFT_1749061 [Desarmillaria tabescens]|uniref:Fungal-type protein kinase domain-containing protein n=1 Tax=Armillaria tabescens TaxID=1929756 RepID=A0AA39K792_ARMTA|nr:uncharacterized protein EV420DRAFT_1749061 [Desarmillaria tabescens]KAK0455603.1 hypothetical protein EV420DRAFT_1749061 [Desarmillaria tabescens]